MILVVSCPEDSDTQAVVERMEHGDVFVVDMADIPQSIAVTVAVEDTKDVRRLLHTADGEIDLDNVRVIWWRRIRRHAIAPAIVAPEERNYTEREVALAVGGLLDGLSCAWVNHWAADEAAQRKPFQWIVARSVGLNTPASIVTNDPTRVMEFVEAMRPRDCIYKSLLSPFDWRETRLVRRSDIERIDAVSLCPVIFQEYVPGVDFRVTVVGGDVFTTRIDASATTYPHDMRPVFGEAVVEAVDLPKEIRLPCEALMKKLGLVFGAIDLRQNAGTGEFFFLEVNPAGSWSFVESRTLQPISQAVADELTRLNRQPRASRARKTSSRDSVKPRG